MIHPKHFLHATLHDFKRHRHGEHEHRPGPGGPHGTGGPHGRRGPFDFDEPGEFGPRGPRGFGGRWGGRTRRGEGKFLILEALAEKPQHGYDVMNAIEAKRGFRPSAGSIYPQLQMLEDGGYVSGAENDGKRVYTITDAGRELLATNESRTDDDDRHDARHRARESAMKLMAALMSARASDDATLDKVREIIDRARREIHLTLAGDDET